MSKLNSQNSVTFGEIMMAGNRFGVARFTLAGAFVIPADAPHVLVLDSGGSARTVDLPASPKIGDWFWIIAPNGTGALTLRNGAGVAIVPAGVVAVSTSMLVVYTGLAEPGGWRVR